MALYELFWYFDRSKEKKFNDISYEKKLSKKGLTPFLRVILSFLSWQ